MSSNQEPNSSTVAEHEIDFDLDDEPEATDNATVTSPPPTTNTVIHHLSPERPATPETDNTARTPAASSDAAPATPLPPTGTSQHVRSQSPTPVTPSAQSTSFPSSSDTDLSAVHLFPSGLTVPIASTSPLPFPPIASCDTAALESLIAGLNRDNERLSNELKLREAQVEQLHVAHQTERRRWREDNEQLRQELHRAQTVARIVQSENNNEGSQTLRDELRQQQLKFQDRENQLQYEIQRLQQQLTDAESQAQAQLSSQSQTQSHSRPVPALDPARLSSQTEHLQATIASRDAEIADMRAKLQWYIENQAVIDEYRQKEIALNNQINELKKQLKPSVSASGSDKNKQRSPKKVPSNVSGSVSVNERIKLIERENEQLKKKLKSGQKPSENSVLELLEAARADASLELVLAPYKARVAELETEIETRDTDWENRFRSLRQEQERIKHAYDRRLLALQEAIKQFKLSGIKNKCNNGNSANNAVIVALQTKLQQLEFILDDKINFYKKKIENAIFLVKRGIIFEGVDDDSDDLTSAVNEARERSASASAEQEFRSSRLEQRGTPPSHSERRGKHQRDRSPSPTHSQSHSAAHSPKHQRPALTKSELQSPSKSQSRSQRSIDSEITALSLETQLRTIRNELSANHRDEFDRLTIHYDGMIDAIKQQNSQALTALQSQLLHSEAQSSLLVEQIQSLQSDLVKAQLELRSKQNELQVLQAKPGVREFSLLDREIRELQSRLERRDREYCEEIDAMKLREEEERIRLTERYEAIVKRKAEQIRAIEFEMEKVIDESALTLSKLREQDSLVQSLQSQLDETRKQLAAEKEWMVGSASASAVTVPDYLALMEKVERGIEDELLFSISTRASANAQEEVVRGKENKLRASANGGVSSSGVKVVKPRVTPVSTRHPLPAAASRSRVPVSHVKPQQHTK